MLSIEYSLIVRAGHREAFLSDEHNTSPKPTLDCKIPILTCMIGMHRLI